MEQSTPTREKPAVERHDDGKFYVGDEEISEAKARALGWSEEREAQIDPDNIASDEEPSAGRQAVMEAGRSKEAAKEMDPTERMDAVEWFMADDPEEKPAQRVLELDVSTDPDHPVVIKWIVHALERETLQSIRNKARVDAAPRHRRRGVETEEDTALANARIAAAGTLYPNLRDERVRGEFMDPADALKYRFRHKSGIIDQIAAHVISVSGYDDGDVKEVDAVGN